MGWWSSSIMGGDEPLDIKDDFEDLTQPVSPGAAIDFIHTASKLGYDDAIVRQVVGFQMIEKGYPMTAELKALVIGGIDAEDVIDWSNPDERREKLAQFKQAVRDYPESGGPSNLPHQEGLFEVIGKTLSGS